MKIEFFSKKVIPFKSLENGDAFYHDPINNEHPFFIKMVPCAIYRKTGTSKTAITSDKWNAVSLTDGYPIFVEDDARVMPLEGTLKLMPGQLNAWTTIGEA